VQEPACAAANERRRLIMNNEWALLDTLEVSQGWLMAYQVQQRPGIFAASCS